jgi:hypothetical protein
MATKRFLGAQVRRFEILSITITAVGVGDAVTYTLNGKAIQYVPITGDTVATTAAGLAAAITNAQDAEFRQYTVSIDSTVAAKILLIGTTAGLFISADGNTAPSVAGTGSTTVTSAVEQAAKSPLDGSDTVNWSGGALPANSGDDWYFEDAAFPMQYNLAALSGKSAASLRVLNTFAGSGIGLPKFNANGYTEYRGGRLALTACTILFLELPDSTAADAFRFDVGSAQCTADIRGNSLGGVGAEVVDFVGTHASNTMEVVGASVKIAPYVGDLATVATLSLVSSGATVGAGTTLGTLNMQVGSTALVRCAITTATIADGSALYTAGTGGITTANVQEASTIVHNSTGTIGTLILGPDAVADFSQVRDAVTITNTVQLYRGSAFLDPRGRVTLSGGYETIECKAEDCTLQFGPNRTYTVT